MAHRLEVSNQGPQVRPQQAMAGDRLGNRLDKFLVAVGTETGIAPMFFDRRLDDANIHLLDNAHGLWQQVEFATAVWALEVAIIKRARQFFGKIRTAKMPRMSRLRPGFTVRWRLGWFHQIRRRRFMRGAGILLGFRQLLLDVFERSA